jgi:hypothetical protein
MAGHPSADHVPVEAQRLVVVGRRDDEAELARTGGSVGVAVVAGVAAAGASLVIFAYESGLVTPEDRP